MASATYKVVPHEGGWGMDHQGRVAGSFASKEAALEAAIGPAMNAIKEGHEVVLSVPGSAGDQSALGTRER